MYFRSKVEAFFWFLLLLCILYVLWCFTKLLPNPVSGKLKERNFHHSELGFFFKLFFNEVLCCLLTSSYMWPWLSECSGAFIYQRVAGSILSSDCLLAKVSLGKTLDRDSLANRRRQPCVEVTAVTVWTSVCVNGMQRKQLKRGKCG